MISDKTLLEQAPDWIWESHHVLSLKYEKTIATLSAIRKALLQQSSRSDQASQFCEQVDWALGLPSDVVESTWRDPQAYFFARTAYDLYLAAYLEIDLPSGTRAYVDELSRTNPDCPKSLPQLFDGHLERFGLFAVSFAIAAQQSISIRPLSLDLPETLPGTRWSFSGTESLQLCGVDPDGHLGLKTNDEVINVPLPDATLQKESWAIHVAPVIGAIRLQPPAFNLPGLRDIRSVVPASVDGQAAYCRIVTETLDLIRLCDPQTAEQIDGVMQVLAMKPAGFGGVFNTSCSRLPGAAVFSGARCRAMLADDLIHEFYHNRLFAIEEQGPFFAESTSDQRWVPETVYSPWRDDPRPIYGLFHAVYVFERVLRFWISAIQGDALNVDELQFGKYRASKLIGQLQISLEQLIAWGEFTDRGQTLCHWLRHTLEQRAQQCAALELGGHTTVTSMDEHGNSTAMIDKQGRFVTVAQELRRHIEIYDTNRRCEQLPRLRERFLAAMALP
ncbi:HEXXH motif-containing putative peptide modification protein [Roseiconus lacunae]|uniref:aKG-HExxH-type peptide beta-hydroxylase n=1 Tax=Roseiconus lacunae TaxID=2605694 RepID=UPI00308DB725|nr:HEXXH motif-containing putative peptide modification protein [Stieleria sp. HD01]